VEQQDPELACSCIKLFYRELGEDVRDRLIGIVVGEYEPRHLGSAFRMLRDQPLLQERQRNELLRFIVESGDKTTCNLVLEWVDDLGAWAPRLRAALD
jgi:hypothetical protein